MGTEVPGPSVNAAERCIFYLEATVGCASRYWQSACLHETYDASARLYDFELFFRPNYVDAVLLALVSARIFLVACVAQRCSQLAGHEIRRRFRQLVQRLLE